MYFLLKAKVSYLKTCQGKGSYNKFLINNKLLIVSELTGRPWKNQNSIWKKRFITATEKILEIENSQKLELIKASQVKLKRKVDLQSVKIFDRPTSQQGRQIFMVPLKRNDAVIMNMLFTSIS
uniref:Uncharacterized protein n=1 Tax=Rhizophagus irregularis (strain DAOM 181602 / DAOM 197198 / MUCL 43194) TaxID=747089 RepID=U9TA90_RHIID